MNSGYKVEYSDDHDEVCIIPWPAIPCNDLMALVNMFGSIGYKWWQKADERRGFIFTKKKRKQKENDEISDDRKLDNQLRKLHTRKQRSG